MLSHLRRHSGEFFSCGSAEKSDLLDELTTFSLSREDWSAGEELGQDTPDSPHVNSCGVVTAGED